MTRVPAGMRLCADWLVLVYTDSSTLRNQRKFEDLLIFTEILNFFCHLEMFGQIAWRVFLYFNCYAGYPPKQHSVSPTMSTDLDILCCHLWKNAGVIQRWLGYILNYVGTSQSMLPLPLRRLHVNFFTTGPCNFRVLTSIMQRSRKYFGYNVTFCGK